MDHQELIQQRRGEVARSRLIFGVITVMEGDIHRGIRSYFVE